MSGIPAALIAASMVHGAMKREEGQQIEQQKTMEMQEHTEKHERTLELLEQQLENERRRNPTNDSIDSFYGTQIRDIEPGEAVVIEYEPRRGYDLYVDRVYVDRRDDLEYHINMNGNVTSGANEYNATPPRLVTQHGKVTIELVNVGSTAHTVDVQIDAWAEAK